MSRGYLADAREREGVLGFALGAALARERLLVAFAEGRGFGAAETGAGEFGAMSAKDVPAEPGPVDAFDCRSDWSFRSASSQISSSRPTGRP